MAHHRTFPISNLTLGLKLGFSQTCFSFQELHLRFFLSNFVFPLKNKTKISGDSKSFYKNQIFTKQIKKRVLLSSGNASSEMRGPQNGNSTGEKLKGQTWTQVEGNVAFDWLISGYPSLHVFVWLSVDYTLRALICLSVMHVWLLLFIRDVDMLITSIDSLTYFSIVTLLVVWLSCFPRHIYSHFCISHSSWHDLFYLLYIILFISTYCLFLLYSSLAYHLLA